MDGDRETTSSTKRRDRRSRGRGNPSSRRRWIVVLLALVVLAGGAGAYGWVVGFPGVVDESAVRAAEEKRDALLASTVPKAELWAEVARRGLAVKKGKETLAAIAPIEARITAIEAELAGLEGRGAAIEARAAQIAEERAQAERALADARAEVERLVALERGLGGPARPAEERKP